MQWPITGGHGLDKSMTDDARKMTEVTAERVLKGVFQLCVHLKEPIPAFYTNVIEIAFADGTTKFSPSILIKNIIKNTRCIC